MVHDAHKLLYIDMFGSFATTPQNHEHLSNRCKHQNAVVYHNMGKHNLFWIHVDVTLFDLKDQLNQINGRLNHKDTRMVDCVEYHRPLVDSMEVFGSSI